MRRQLDFSNIIERFDQRVLADNPDIVEVDKKVREIREILLTIVQCRKVEAQGITELSKLFNVSEDEIKKMLEDG